MAPARKPQQAQRAQRLTKPAVAKHLEQHEGAATYHQNLANLPAGHAHDNVLTHDDHNGLEGVMLTMTNCTA